MDEFTKLVSKIDFNNFFSIQLTRYVNAVDKCRTDGAFNFHESIALKEIFQDNLFQWFIKKINEPIGVITPEILTEVAIVWNFLNHSKEHNTVHTMVPNDVLERLLNVISKPSNQQNNQSAKVSSSGKS